MSKKDSIASKALVAAMGAESGVAHPARARSASFASMVTDLKLGDSPAARTVKLDGEFSLNASLGQIAIESEKLRNAVTSSVAQAKRKIPGAEYSIETTSVTTKSGLYVIALVTRTV